MTRGGCQEVVGEDGHGGLLGESCQAATDRAAQASPALEGGEDRLDPGTQGGKDGVDGGLVRGDAQTSSAVGPGDAVAQAELAQMVAVLLRIIGRICNHVGRRGIGIVPENLINKGGEGLAVVNMGGGDLMGCDQTGFPVDYGMHFVAVVGLAAFDGKGGVGIHGPGLNWRHGGGLRGFGRRLRPSLISRGLAPRFISIVLAPGRGHRCLDNRGVNDGHVPGFDPKALALELLHHRFEQPFPPQASGCGCARETGSGWCHRAPCPRAPNPETAGN